MQMILGPILGALGIGGTTSVATAGTWAAANAGGAIASTAGSGLSLASILQGTASVLGVVSSIGAGAAEADALEMQAADAEAEKPLENLQGIARRSSIKRQMAEALGAQDVAYAASGVDLSFGTARQARTDAYRDADLALTTDAGTQETRLSRLTERAANYRSAAKQARRGGLMKGLLGGLDTVSSFAGRGGW